MNCPNCGAPVKGKTCEYCGTEHASIEDDIEHVEIFSWDGTKVLDLPIVDINFRRDVAFHKRKEMAE